MRENWFAKTMRFRHESLGKFLRHWEHTLRRYGTREKLDSVSAVLDLLAHSVDSLLRGLNFRRWYVVLV